MIERRYKCDLCRIDFDPRRLIGLYWATNTVIVEKPAHETEHHICFKCLASLQAMDKRCGAGIKNCNGGPKCDYDHK